MGSVSVTAGGKEQTTDGTGTVLVPVPAGTTTKFAVSFELAGFLTFQSIYAAGTTDYLLWPVNAPSGNNEQIIKEMVSHKRSAYGCRSSTATASTWAVCGNMSIG